MLFRSEGEQRAEPRRTAEPDETVGAARAGGEGVRFRSVHGMGCQESADGGQAKELLQVLEEAGVLEAGAVVEHQVAERVDEVQPQARLARGG